VCGVLFGLLPALTATQGKLQDVLRGGSASASPRPRRLRRTLVAADVALALVLVSGAALLLRSFGRLVHVDPGFDPAGATSLRVGVPGDAAHIRAVVKRMRLPSSTFHSPSFPTTRSRWWSARRRRRARSCATCSRRSWRSIRWRGPTSSGR